VLFSEPVELGCLVGFRPLRQVAGHHGGGYTGRIRRVSIAGGSPVVGGELLRGKVPDDMQHSGAQRATGDGLQQAVVEQRSDQRCRVH